MESSVAAAQTFCTRDGVDLHYWEAGAGPTLLLLPGWSQTAAMFRQQIAGLSDRFHCIALDHRGHGESAKVEFGYRISRLACDLRELILARDLSQITLLGHSMGGAVILSYWDLFGADRLARIVIDDQPAALTLRDTESAEAKKQAGMIFPWPQLVKICTALQGSDAENFTRKMVGKMLSDPFRVANQEWIVAENLKLPRRHAAHLLFNGALHDWRDLIPHIRIPTLVIAGKASVVPWRSQVWIHEQIPGSRLEIFEQPEGGYHFAFLENPKKFNDLLAEFILSS